MYAEVAMVVGTILILAWLHCYERRNVNRRSTFGNNQPGYPSMFPCSDPSKPTPAGGDYSDLFSSKGNFPEIPKLPQDDECE